MLRAYEGSTLLEIAASISHSPEKRQAGDMYRTRHVVCQLNVDIFVDGGARGHNRVSSIFPKVFYGKMSVISKILGQK